ncbi:MAG: CDP-alcohol phosphatidyltransferase family protein [Candidatus Pacebacteria bacterium]|nr:CDP-alcohol phosphatidyltransferase family protein [Candidatus Paceibacterota bacterium]
MRKRLTILADALTLFRGVTIPHLILFLLIAKIRSFTLLLILLSIGWITDWYDGMVARKSQHQSKIGAYEILFDHIFIAFIAVYLCFVIPMPWYLLFPLSFWLFLSILAIYGTLRHQKKSFVAGMEVFVAPAIAAGILVYTFLYESLLNKYIAIAFLTLGIFHLKVGFRARKRAKEFLSSLPQDIQETVEALKLYLEKRQRK